MKTTKKTIAFAGLILLLVSCNDQQETRPQRKTLQQAVFASGFLEQEDEYVIAATADGTIQELNIREGDSVSKNQLLVRVKSDVSRAQLEEAKVVYTDARQSTSLNAPQLSQIQSQIELAKTQLEKDKTNYQRYTELRSKNSVSQSELEKAELQYKASQSNLKVLEMNYKQVRDALELNAERSLQEVKTQQALLNEYNIKADKDGIVLQVLKKKGELVRKGEIIARIGSGKHLLKLFIAEDDITKLATGQEAVVQMNNYPDTTFTATITKIYPAFDQSQQSYTAEAVFVNPPPLLLSGTQLQANIKQRETKDVLVIPASAVIRGKYVLLKDGEEKEIRIGQKLGHWVEVKSGLTEDDTILLPAEEEPKNATTMPGME